LIHFYKRRMFGLPCCWVSYIQYILVLVFLLLLLVCAVVKMTTEKIPNILTFPQEKFFIDEEGKEVEFPSLEDQFSIDLSVIVPAYNEEERLPTMLDEALDFLDKRKKTSYEVIIVDDGSKDKTSEVGRRYTKKFGGNKVRVLTLAKNRGKGGAVRMGMLRARGLFLLFADADGATFFPELSKLEEEMNRIDDDGQGIVCGSRAHLQDESIASRTLVRTILMYGFHFCVWIFAVKNVRDTQCGFKLLDRSTARIVFRSLHIERWAFDVEMLKIAEMLSIPVSEVAVKWTEIEGSKLSPLMDAIQMFRDIFLLWLRYAIGAWTISSKQD